RPGHRCGHLLHAQRRHGRSDRAVSRRYSLAPEFCEASTFDRRDLREEGRQIRGAALLQGILTGFSGLARFQEGSEENRETFQTVVPSFVWALPSTGSNKLQADLQVSDSRG